MSRPRQAQSVPVEIPYRGMSTRYPLAKMPPQFCPWIEGYQLGAGFLESPKGVKYVFAGEVGPVSTFAQDPGNPEEIVQFSQDGTLNARAWNVFSESSGVTDTGGTGAGEAMFSFNFGDNVIVCQNGQDPHTWSGSSLDIMTFTGPTLDNIIGGTSYNSQLYVFEKESTSVWFRDSVGAITGALTEYDLNLVSKYNGNVMSVFTFTLSSSLDTQWLWGAALDSGEVIIATGTDPADAATWRVIGRLLVGRPLGYNNYIEKDGDVLLVTSTGIVSVRQLLLNQDPNNPAPPLTYDIEKYWQQLVSDTEDEKAATSYAPESDISSSIRGVWHKQENRLYIFSPKTLIPFESTNGQFGYQITSGTMVLIYDFNYQGWTARRFHTEDELPGGAIPGGEDFKIIASYYEPKKAQIYFSTNDPSSKAVWKLKGNSRFSDNASSPTVMSTSSTSASTVTTVNYYSSTDWIDASNSIGSDNSYATCTLPSNNTSTHWLLFSDFGLAIPAGANIVGITISVECKVSEVSGGALYARISNGDFVSNTIYAVSGFPTTDTTLSLGGNFQGFGESLTVSEVNSSDFSLFLRFFGEDVTVSVDDVSIVVSYVEDLSLNDSNIPLKIISAPLAITHKNQEVKGWKLQQSGDIYSKQALTIKSQGDISAKVSGTTSNSTLPAGISRDLYSAGISADLIQYTLSTSTTKDDDRPHSILSIAPVMEVGGETG